jgi:hypothetical protein
LLPMKASPYSRQEAENYELPNEPAKTKAKGIFRRGQV